MSSNVKRERESSSCDLDQQRAAFAWGRVELARSRVKDYKSYKNLAKGAPAMIMSNGLMPTMAFFHSKGKEHHEQLLADILVWLSKEFAMPNDYAAMMNALFHAKSDKYRRAIDETMQMLRWLRQFADTGEDQSGDQS